MTSARLTTVMGAFILAAAILWQGAAAVAQGSTNMPVAPDIKRILDKKELIISVLKEDSPPFFFVNSAGELVGIDIDLGRALAERLGVKVRFIRKADDWGPVIAKTINHEADIAISAIFPTLERAYSVIFSEPYFSLGSNLLVNRVKAARLHGSENVNTFNQPSVTIGVIRSSAYINMVKERFPAAKYKTYDERTQLLNDVMSGTITCALTDSLETQKWRVLRKDLDLHLVTIKDPGALLPVAIAVPYHDQNLANWINLFIQTIRREGKLQNILRTYGQGPE